MSNQPKLMTEEIELIPHPMDAWRAALDAVIASAPGDECAIAWHLADAQAKLTVCVDRTPATEGTRRLVDRLMLIGAGRQAQADPVTVASLNRRVTARLTVVVNGTDYDVSNMPGVMVGDMIGVDPNNMPPVATGNVIGLGFQGRLDPFAPIQSPSLVSPGAPAQPADVRPIETSVGPASAPLYPDPAVPGGEPVVPMHTSSQPGEPEAHQCSDDPA